MPTTNSHEVTRTRTTYDGVTVQFWTDGAVTVGHPYSNKLVARGLSPAIVASIEGDVCTYDAADIGTLIKAARRADVSMSRIAGRNLALGRDATERRRLTHAFAAMAAVAS